MTPLSPLAAVMQLTRDTFRQAWASGIFWLMLAVTGICVLFCLSVSVSGAVPDLYGTKDEPGLFRPRPEPAVWVPSVVQVLGSSGTLDTLLLTEHASRTVWHNKQTNPELGREEGFQTVSGRLDLVFGAISVPLTRRVPEAVHFLELILAEGVAGILGILLALVWTAGFVPAFLDPSAAAVLLAKPIPRWQLLLGKYLGVLVFLGFQVVVFVVLTWLALAVRTGIWDLAYWWAIPLLLLQFAVFYSFSVLLAVATRSTAACVVGTVLFWLLAWGINYGSIMAQSLTKQRELPAATSALARTAYWISPKPIDAGLILFNALGAQEHFKKRTEYQLIEAGEEFSPILSILSCLGIAVVLLGLSAYEFSTIDY